MGTAMTLNELATYAAAMIRTAKTAQTMTTREMASQTRRASKVVAQSTTGSEQQIVAMAVRDTLANERRMRNA